MRIVVVLILGPRSFSHFAVAIFAFFGSEKKYVLFARFLFGFLATLNAADNLSFCLFDFTCRFPCQS